MQPTSQGRPWHTRRRPPSLRLETSAAKARCRSAGGGGEAGDGRKRTERLETRISLLCIKVEFGSDRFSQIPPSCRSTAVFLFLFLK